MKTILIAGAGQLGSRHLQGVKTSINKLDIWVYDLSEESLKVAEERYNQVESDNKTAHFVTSIDLVPAEIDIVIVASGSKPRAAIIKSILTQKQVKYMILEKFLFPRLSEYEEIDALLNENNVKTWVNCPRRMWDGYNLIEQFIDKNLPVNISYKDTEWGLCCNTVHYLDIFMKLCGCTTCSVDISGLIPEVLDSKRAGYVELYGTEVFTTPNKSQLTLTCTTEKTMNPKVVIKNGDNLITYNEGEGEISINDKSRDVKVHYQSGLTGVLVDELLSKGNCRLSSYKESATYHKTYLQAVGPFINKIKGWTSDSCPIT